MRMSRKMGLIKGIVLPSLYELWSDATIVNVYGAHSSSLTRYSGISMGDTSAPLWVIASAGSSVMNLKLKNNTREILYFWQAADQAIYEGIDTGIDTGSTTAATKVYVERDNGGNGVYGYAMVGLRFPSFPEKVIDKMLGTKTFMSLDAYQYSSGTASLYIADDSLSSDPDDVYLQIGATAAAGYFSVTRGGTPGTPIVSSGNIAFWRHYNSRYYWSTNGTSNSTTRVAGLYKMKMRQQ